MNDECTEIEANTLSQSDVLNLIIRSDDIADFSSKRIRLTNGYCIPLHDVTPADVDVTRVRFEKLGDEIYLSPR
jgi:hypothetical protein